MTSAGAGESVVSGEPDPWTRRTFALALAPIMLAQGMVIFDTAGVSTLARTIQLDLRTSLTGVQYGIGGQLLFAAAFMMVAARLGAVLGRKKMVIFGVALRILGTIVILFSQNATMFFLGRAVLCGISTSFVIVNGLAIIAASFVDARRVKAASVSAAVVAVALISAPLAGGMFASTVGWRWFYLVVLVGSVAAMCFTPFLPRIAPTTSEGRVDFLGAILAIISFGCVIFGIQQITPWGLNHVRNPPFTIFGKSPAPFIVVLGLLLLVAFGLFETWRRNTGRPVLFDTKMLRNHFVRTGNLALTGIASILFGTFFLVPVYLQIVQGLSPFESSLRTVFYGIGAFTMARLFSRLSQRFSLRGMFFITMGVIALGTALLAWDITPLPYGALPVAMFCFGLALSSSKPALQVATQRVVPLEDRGQLAAMNEAGWSLGGALGIAIVGTLLLAALTSGIQQNMLSDSRLGPEAKAVVQKYIERGIAIVPDTRVRTILTNEGISKGEIEIMSDHYSDAATWALLASVLGTSILALISFGFVLRLPKKDPEPVDV